MKFIFNNTDEEKNIRGVIIASKAFYAIPENLIQSWANDVNVNQMVLSAELLVSIDGIEKFDDAVVGLSYLKGLISNVKVEELPQSYPFCKKILPDGKKVFRRKHGFSKLINAGTSDTISIVVPYAVCKINSVEVVNANACDIGNLKVYDTNTGTISGYPNVLLNQFGFNVCLAKDFYKDKSDYDADLIGGLKIEIEITNNGTDNRVYGVNFTLHELK